MIKPKNTYANAGRQNQQGWSEVERYGDFEPDRLVTVKCVALILEIRLQMVKQIPVKRHMIDKRGYYRKGDIDAWLLKDLTLPDSLIHKLRAEHAKSLKRMEREKTRPYVSGQLSREESAQVKAVNSAFVPGPFTIDEASGGWSKGLPRRRNKPLLEPRPVTEEDAKMGESMAAEIRKLLNGDA